MYTYNYTILSFSVPLFNTAAVEFILRVVMHKLLGPQWTPWVNLRPYPVCRPITGRFLRPYHIANYPHNHKYKRTRTHVYMLSTCNMYMYMHAKRLVMGNSCQATALCKPVLSIQGKPSVYGDHEWVWPVLGPGLVHHNYLGHSTTSLACTAILL